MKIDKDGNVSTFVTNTNRTIGLAYDTKGRLVGVESNIQRIEVLYPTRTTLVEQIDGVPIVAPNDIVADSKGGMYFTDTLNSRFRPTPPSRTKPWIVYIRPELQTPREGVTWPGSWPCSGSGGSAGRYSCPGRTASSPRRSPTSPPRRRRPR